MGEPNYLKIQKTARYYLSGPVDASYDSLCFVLHGYGQLAKFFVRPFEGKALRHTLFVAPEGLHRFYLNGTSGRVGASWMTKEDRLKDIEDYCNYLDHIYEDFKDVAKHVDQIGLLGFSQGVATACRWLTASRHRFDYLINYAGAFPPDLDHRRAIGKMSKIPVHLLVGNKDEYISEEKYRQHLAELEESGYSVKPRVFEGSHRIYPEVLKEVFGEVLA